MVTGYGLTCIQPSLTSLSSVLLTCDIAAYLRQVVESSLQVCRPSVDANHYHLCSKMALGLLGMIRRFWPAFTRSLASCFLLRAARSRRSGGATVNGRTVRQITRCKSLAYRSSAAPRSASNTFCRPHSWQFSVSTVS
jgi:hypothetical protein